MIERLESLRSPRMSDCNRSMPRSFASRRRAQTAGKLRGHVFREENARTTAACKSCVFRWSFHRKITRDANSGSCAPPSCTSAGQDASTKAGKIAHNKSVAYFRVRRPMHDESRCLSSLLKKEDRVACGELFNLSNASSNANPGESVSTCFS